MATTASTDGIQAAGSNTRPPILDRTDYESWAQRIRLYCRGKENGENILRSINEGPLQQEMSSPPLMMGLSPLELTGHAPTMILVMLKRSDMMLIFVPPTL